MNFTLACDIMMDLEGSIRPAIYLARALVDMGLEVSMISPAMSNEVKGHLTSLDIVPLDLNVRLYGKSFGLSLLWLETWGREAFLKLNSRRASREHFVKINFSHTLVVPSLFWYLQGPTSTALRDMENELTGVYKSVYKILKPAIEYSDGRLIRDIKKESRFTVANSKFCASLYHEWGIEADDVIYPPIDCNLFRPETSKPASDYVLTYFGKETKFSAVKAIADQGVKIKAFGSKAPFVPREMCMHPNIDFLGRISADELVYSYSNALYTLFAFTHEPFGYIPVESMSCGTPTLTYNMQGPRESIVDGHTGWLVRNDDEMVQTATRLWQKGYEQKMRSNCRKEATKYDRSIYVGKWLHLLQKYLAYAIDKSL
jgi:glycosyltransferase involved in cell wall biosynthesis